jgi:hypothetical protein
MTKLAVTARMMMMRRRRRRRRDGTGGRSGVPRPRRRFNQPPPLR